MERLTEWQGRIERLAADTKAMSDRLQGLRVTAADTNRMVEVTIDAGGVLVDLRLTQRIQRVAPDVVSRTIMETIRAARKQLADQSQEIIEETLGSESPAGRAVAARVGQQLRPPPADADDRQGER